MIRLYLLAATLAVAGAGGAYGIGRASGYAKGHDAAVARAQEARETLQKQLWRAGETMSRQAAELAAARADQDTRAREFEDEARADVGGNRPGIGADGLRALERLWAAP